MPKTDGNTASAASHGMDDVLPSNARAEGRRERSCTNAFEHFSRQLIVGAKRRIRRIHDVEEKGSVERFVESRPE